MRLMEHGRTATLCFQVKQSARLSLRIFPLTGFTNADHVRPSLRRFLQQRPIMRCQADHLCVLILGPRQIKRQHIIGSRDQKKGRVPIQRCLERYVVQVDYSVQLRVVEKTCFGCSTGQCVGAEATLAVPRERGESTRKAATRGRRGERRVTEIGNLNVRELPGISAEP